MALPKQSWLFVHPTEESSVKGGSKTLETPSNVCTNSEFKWKKKTASVTCSSIRAITGSNLCLPDSAASVASFSYFIGPSHAGPKMHSLRNHFSFFFMGSNDIKKNCSSGFTSNLLSSNVIQKVRISMTTGRIWWSLIIAITFLSLSC